MQKSITIRGDTETMPVFIVRRNSPAMRTFMNISKHKAREGSIIQVTDEEFKSFKEDLLCLAVESEDA